MFYDLSRRVLIFVIALFLILAMLYLIAIELGWI